MKSIQIKDYRTRIVSYWDGRVGESCMHGAGPLSDRRDYHGFRVNGKHKATIVRCREKNMIAICSPHSDDVIYGELDAK